MSIQRLLIGTHACEGEQNYLQILKVKMQTDCNKNVRENSNGIVNDESAAQNAS